MDLYQQAECTKNKNDFIAFLTSLQADFISNKESWENPSIDMFLDAIKSWVNDYHGDDINWDNPDWKSISAMFYMGKIYE